MWAAWRGSMTLNPSMSQFTLSLVSLTHQFRSLPRRTLHQLNLGEFFDIYLGWGIFQFIILLQAFFKAFAFFWGSFSNKGAQNRQKNPALSAANQSPYFT